jgi:DASS family divalent anion:Na+ symporter
MTLFATMLGAVISVTGIGRRLAYYVLSKIGSSHLGVMYATTMVNNILAPFTPSNTARGAIMSGVVDGVCDSMGFKRGEKKGDHSLILANLYTNTTNTFLFFTATGANVIGVNIILKMTGKGVAWIDWFIAASVPAIPILILLPWLVNKMFPPAKEYEKVDKSYALQKLSDMGPMSREEKSCGIIMLMILILWATETIHKIPAASVAFLLGIALVFPGIGPVKWKDIEGKIPWAMLIWLGFAMGIADVINTTGGFKWIIESFFLNSPVFNEISFVGLLLIMLPAIVFLHIIFAGMNAMMAVIVPISIAIATAKGFDPYATGLAATMAVSAGAFFMPFNSAPNLIFFGTGRYDTRQQFIGAIPLAVLIAAALVFALLVWWPAIGML